MNYQITPLKNDDWPQVQSIYKESISTGLSTFDTKTPNWESWDSNRLDSCRFVARKGERIFGWATLSQSEST